MTCIWLKNASAMLSGTRWRGSLLANEVGTMSWVNQLAMWLVTRLWATPLARSSATTWLESQSTRWLANPLAMRSVTRLLAHPLARC